MSDDQERTSDADIRDSTTEWIRFEDEQFTQAEIPLVKKSFLDDLLNG